ncbi:MAG: RecQ family ATP-dependent DNA helicase [Deltaproteobacteria bacterium]|nr:MAG: RecQ family ATP-dependent DNA helicase [Deltaproteobacteria bacterium]
MEMELLDALKQHFGYDAFRKGQEAIVRSVLSGRPTIAILPTGGGKSLCYQLPALLLEGTTVVVSPLVALMKDQVDALRARGIAATFVNSSLPESERQDRQGALRRGEYRLVYVAPERFKSPSFLSAMADLTVPLLAVDEAHCISAWGHDFRPEYQQLARAREQVRAERVLALTATATPEVRRDIADALELRDPRVFVAGFDRPNLFIEVLRVSGDKDKLGRLVALSRSGGPGIVYAATRKNVEKVVGVLRASEIDAVGYHAGMGDAERTAVQERFVRGEARVIVATNAFGMGVDKADIRFVAHFDVPRSLEAYYQEIGRAGRDGLGSHALLLFNFADVMMQRRMIEAGRPSRDLVERAWEAARALLKGSVEEVARSCGCSAPELSGAVRLLESAGHLERGLARDGQFFVATPSVSADDLAVDFELLELRVARERQMLDRLVRFADTRGCRRHNLLRYFGDDDSPRSCDACESCKGSRAPEPEEVTAAPRKRKQTEAPSADDTPYDQQVFEKLRALRTDLARETRVPPYVVFHDATLRELARALPQDEKGFLAVKGAGPGRWQRYGERVVAITRQSPPAETTPVVSEPRSQPELCFGQPRARHHHPSPTDYGPAARVRPATELWALCASGATLADLCARLGRSAGDIASDLADGVQQGKSLDVSRLLGPERADAIRMAARGANGDVVAVRRRLPFPAALAEIRLALTTGEPPRS